MAEVDYPFRSSTSDSSNNVAPAKKQFQRSVYATSNKTKKIVHISELISDEDDLNNIESDGKFYDRQRDPPGQKCVYILPGNTEKETYRVGTFLKFPEYAQEVVDVCDLARYGFYYIGYKDRVKCFSCGGNAYDWTITDEPNDRKWHYSKCDLVEGKETRNVPILKKELVFVGVYFNTFPDSGYASNSYTSEKQLGCRDGTVQKNHCPPPVVADNLPSSSSSTSPPLFSEIKLSKEMKGINLGNTSSDSILHQTARVVQSVKPRFVEGLTFASITTKAHQQLLTKDLDLHKEEDRLKSFQGWVYNFSFVTPDSLAESGFFYLGNSDRVQCFSCTGVLRNWSQNDIVDEQHQRHFPHCKMILKLEERNISLPQTLKKLQKLKKNVPEPADPSLEEMEFLKQQFPCLNPVNPHMRQKESRLETFDRRWPSQKINATPEHIVKAGFFFLGDRDRAKCWYCNGGLQNWEPNDEPFTEHAKWFPGCEYILQCKGVDFVKRIVSKFPNLRRPTLRNPRFDHKTMKLISIEPQPDQHQPLLIDPRANNNSAGNVLRSYSPTNSNSQNSVGNDDSRSKELEEFAMSMGFELPLIKRVIEKKIKSTSGNFENMSDLLDDLVLASDEPQENLSTETPAQLKFDLQEKKFGGNGLVLTNAEPTLSLKRNKDGEGSSNRISNVSESETPLKRPKTDENISEKLANLEHERKCKLCYNAAADNVVLPCGHLSICNNCSTKTKICPLCKEKKQTVIKAYVV